MVESARVIHQYRQLHNNGHDTGDGVVRPSMRAGHRRWTIGRALLSVGMLTAAGCTRDPLAPSIVVFGSYFPAWLLCAGLGIITTVVARLILVHAGIDEHLPAPLLVYLSLALTTSIVYWFLTFGGAPH